MRRGRTRNIIASVLGVLAVLLIIIGTVAVWARVTVTSSDRVADLAVAAYDEAEVQAALSDYLTDLTFSAVDVDAALNSLLPSELQRVAPVIDAGIRAAVERGVSALLAQPAVKDVFRGLVERAHSAAMRLLQGDGLVDGISVVDGTVTINLLPLIGRAVGVIQGFGLLENVQLPDLTASGDPTEQIKELEQALGRDLPDDFGQLAVYHSDSIAKAQGSLEQAQRTLVLAKRALWLVLALSVVLVAASILVAANRWRAAFLLGLGMIVALVLTRGAVERIVAAAPDVADKPGGQAAIAAIVGGAATSLMRLTALLILLALVVVIIAMAVRRWRFSDVLLAIAVVAGVLLVGVLGLTIWSLLAGLVLAVAVVLVTPRVLHRRASAVEVEAATPTK